MMERVMFQADRLLLERARRTARRRGITFPEFVRQALEHELDARADQPRALSCVGIIDTRGQARRREYAPEPWR
jgi:hypothetical protein